MVRNPLLSYVVVKIAIINILVYLITSGSASVYTHYLALDPLLVYQRGFIWQIFTYMFVHYGFFHLLFNMFVLFMFGMQVEEVMGKRKFVFFYLFCGVGAGVIIFLVSLFTYFSIGQLSITLGASGAVFAVLVAFAFYYPDAQILLFFVIPVRAKYMVLLYVAYDLYSYMFRVGGNISHVGHIGGVIFALLYFLVWGRSARRGGISRIVGEVQKKQQQIKEKVETEQEIQMKRDIIKKIRASATKDDLTDDEFQFIKYCHILYDVDEPVEGDILEQEMISNKQFITEVRKFISLK